MALATKQRNDVRFPLAKYQVSDEYTIDNLLHAAKKAVDMLWIDTHDWHDSQKHGGKMEDCHDQLCQSRAQAIREFYERHSAYLKIKKLLFAAINKLKKEQRSKR